MIALRGARILGWTLRSLSPLALLAFGLIPAVAQGAAPGDAALRIGLVAPAPADPAAAGGAHAATAEALRHGAEMAAEEYAQNARFLGGELELLTVEVADAEAARAAAEWLVTEEEVKALVGGFGEAEALALRDVAEARGVPFLNIGTGSDRLRGEACGRFTFHIVPSDAMYLDALLGFFVRSDFRRWFFVAANDATGEARLERMRWGLRTRHFGAREVGHARVPEDPEALAGALDETLQAIRRTRPEVVLLLVDSAAQLAFLERYEASGLEAAVTGMPELAAQTRAFFAAAREAAPVAGAGFRATAWEASLDRYGAREFNARYLDRYGEPMETPAWAVYQAVKILYESAFIGGARQPKALAEHLTSSQALFDVWKGIGVTFRPWDRQLRQSLYLVQIHPEADDPFELAALVGELPALYLPRTDPVERLDQLGNLASRSKCDK